MDSQQPPADVREPPKAIEPIEEPSTKGTSLPESLPELHLLNKWRSDVLRSGVPYTNFELDACVRRVQWNPANERIEFEMHWEDGKYVAVSDFGRFDRYASAEERRRVFEYLQPYDGLASRPRMILTVKGMRPSGPSPQQPC